MRPSTSAPQPFKNGSRGIKLVSLISAHEFIRRFLLHVLPHNFMKIRYFGFLSHRNKKLPNQFLNSS
ncbi:MAG: transposase [Desulfobacula sp.]|nr:transposase [Desulfobacula sp.]